MIRAALDFSHSARVIEPVSSERRRARLASLLDQVEPLATSAGIFTVTFELLFTLALLSTFSGDAAPSAEHAALAIALGVPSLLIFVEVLPSVLARRYGDSLLRTWLPAFNVLQLPIGLIVVVMDFIRKSLRRMVGLPESTTSTREIVEDLREVIVDTAKKGGLDDHERELIENVMEFRDVDVAAVMTPRTEISGVEVEEGLAEAVRIAARSKHSRIPVYEDNLDTIIGTVTARDVVQIAASGKLEEANLREVLHPAYFVPETKHVSELLAEFRREKLKMAIVLDEYGGTAGIVTLGDVIEEIVGDIHEEFEEDEPLQVRKLSDSIAEVDASLHVTEVNEELDLELPEEEDFETLGGFVLAELGRMPKAGDCFEHGGVDFAVVEASDRRVITVRVENRTKTSA